MTRGTFRALVESICRYSGIQYLEDAPAVNDLINERVRSFAERTRCLYDDRIVLTLSSSGSTAGVYDLRGSGFGRNVVEVHRLIIDGQPLLNYQGKYGPISLEELAYWHPKYITDSAAKPRRFCHIPPHSIRLYPAPDQAYGSCFAQGWYMPSSITTHASGDSAEIGLPEEFTRAAAYWTATALMVPTSTAQTDFERLAFLNQDALGLMNELYTRSRRLLDGPSIRGALRYRRGF